MVNKAEFNDAPAVLIFYENILKDDAQTLLQLISKNRSPLEQHIFWTIENKYYSANVNLRLVDVKSNVEKAVWEQTDAVLYFYHIDLDEENDKVKKSYEELLATHEKEIEEFDPEIKICIGKQFREQKQVDSTASDGVNYCEVTPMEKEIEKTNRHCVSKGFEFIEIPFDWAYIADSENEDDDWEVQGVDRIIEALQANMWSTMVMKENSSDNGNAAFAAEIAKIEAAEKVIDENNSSSLKPVELDSNGIPKKTTQDSTDPLDGFLSSEEVSLLNENLFKTLSFESADSDERDLEAEYAVGETLNRFREKGQSLPDDQRRALAERIAMQMFGDLDV